MALELQLYTPWDSKARIKNANQECNLLLILCFEYYRLNLPLINTHGFQVAQAEKKLSVAHLNIYGRSKSQIILYQLK